MNQNSQHDRKKRNSHVDIRYNTKEMYKNQVLGSSQDDWVEEQEEETWHSGMCQPNFADGTLELATSKEYMSICSIPSSRMVVQPLP